MGIDQITTEMAEHICDNLCRYPKELTENELEEICCECKLGQYICNILNVYQEETNQETVTIARLYGGNGEIIEERVDKANKEVSNE